MSIIENWSDFVGGVIAIDPAPDLSGYAKVELQVLAAEAVQGFPNLAENEIHNRIEVRFPREIVSQREIASGSVVECRVRKAARQSNLVHRDRVRVRGST